MGPKENKEKPRMSVLPMDILQELLLPALEEGEIKYYRNSYREGFKVSEVMDSCQRHLTEFFYLKNDYDQESIDRFGIKKHHLGGAMANILFMYISWRMGGEHDDR